MVICSPVLDQAFLEKPHIKLAIYAACSKDPALSELFTGISEYVLELQRGLALTGDRFEEPVAKKRRLNDAKNGRELPDRSTIAELESMKGEWSSVATIEVSFSVPQRKKLLLQISPKKPEGIRALNPTNKQREFGVPWKDIDHVVCLPVPEKAQTPYNFCVFPKYGDVISSPPNGAASYEPMVWTVSDVKSKETGDAKPDHRQSMIDAVKAAGIPVLEPDASEFESQVQQAYRKGEKAYHVKAFRGSKDGFLFFLPTGIVWAFKKPLHFFSFDVISSISYTSVLQRTFNLNITTQSSPAIDLSASASQDFEFSMIDQADFAGIDTYVKRHQLQDASMAEERRAKKLNINGVKGQTDEETGLQQSELEKAAREAEVRDGDHDDEDEEDDENFDPGSEGESEGSGTSDEDEDGGGSGGGEEGAEREDEDEELEGENEVAGED